MSSINQLQVLQQNLQNNLLQKQQVQSQLVEIESALKELENTSQAYKIVGKIMIASDKESLLKELQEKKEVVNVRLNNFTKQEESLQKNIEELQQEVMKEMKSNPSSNET